MSGGFEVEEVAGAKGPQWSFQRHLTWGNCKRQYFFEYAAGDDPAVDEPLREEVRLLKPMTSLRFMRGLVVHMEVGRLAKRMAQGELVDVGAAASEMAQWVDRMKEKGPDQIAEVRNGARVPGAVFEGFKAEAAEEVRNFLGGPWEATSQLKGLEVEAAGQFQVDEARVSVRVDALGRARRGRLVIVDWKSGEDDPAFESGLQVGVYALWAVEVGRARPGEVETRLVFLKGGIEHRLVYGRADLERVRAFIRADMKVMEPPPGMERAAPSPEARRCLACKFATVCEAADLSGAAASVP